MQNEYLIFNLQEKDIQLTNQSFTNKILTVEGGGVNATVLHPDLGARNGFIHVIDRVLGIPYATVGRKVSTDPVLK